MQLSTLLARFYEKGIIHCLDCGRRGIEKEGLRYSNLHQLATTPHPAIYGSPLTHDEITTDYAEALLEIVTPAFRNSKDTYAHLCYLHRVIAQNPNEYMLGGSMPARIEHIDEVAIGYYGESNAGKMRRLYRKGLALRYGKPMQLIAGIHFNYSLCLDLLKAYANILGDTFSADFVNQKYMNMVRNIRRYSFLTAYLFGHSPALDRSFFAGRAHRLEKFDDETYSLPYATSLRLSDIGYQNKSGYTVRANHLKEYTHDLIQAVMTPSEAFAALGLYDKNGDYQQINTHLLQIENEYYSAVRPKQITKSGEPPVKALHERGIAYVELRTLDINCFDRNGISQEQLDFLELFMLYCLLENAPEFDETAEQEAKQNLAQTAIAGRDPQLLLMRDGKSLPLADYASALLDAMRPIAEMMDTEKHRPHYVSLIERQLQVANNPKLTPSARIMAILGGESTGQPMTYHEFITDLSMRYSQESRRKGLTPAEREKVERDAKISQEKAAILLEKSKDVPFDRYLSDYFSQLEAYL